MSHFNDGKVWQVKREPDGYHWSLLTSTENIVVPPTDSTNGPYSKFQLVTVKDSEILIGMLKPAHGIYAFRLPATE